MSSVEQTFLDRVEAILEQWQIGTPSEHGHDVGVGGGAIRGRHKLVQELVEALIDDPRIVVLQLPEGATIGNIREAQGAIFNASAEGVDWERLRDREADAISPTGRLLLDIARQLEVRSR